MNAVLINGDITAKSLEVAKGEIVGLNRRGEPFVLVINSFGKHDGAGGHMKGSIDFVDFIKTDENLRGLKGVKMYEAHSTAAFIALSLDVPKELRSNSRLRIHVGDIGKVEFISLTPEGKIKEEQFEELSAYYARTMELIDRLEALTTEEIQGTLSKEGSVFLNAEECLRRGLVHRLF